MFEMEMIPITSSTRFCDYRVGRVYRNSVTDNIHQHNIHWVFTLNDGLWLMWDMIWSIFAWFKALILLSAKLPSWKLVFRITLTWHECNVSVKDGCLDRQPFSFLWASWPDKLLLTVHLVTSGLFACLSAGSRKTYWSHVHETPIRSRSESHRAWILELCFVFAEWQGCFTNWSEK